MSDHPIQQRVVEGVISISHEDERCEAIMHPSAEGEVWHDGEKVFKTLRNYDAPYLFDVRLKQPMSELESDTFSDFMRDLSSVLKEKFQQDVESAFDEVDSLQDILESDRFSELQ